MKAKLCVPVLLLSWPAIGQVSTGNANDVVHRVVNNEIKSEKQDQSHWMFRLETKKTGGSKEAYLVVESRDGDVSRPLLINGRETPASEANRRVEQLIHNPGALRKSLKDKNEDAARSQRLLKMLPDAFIFKYRQQRGDLMRLDFSPNPQFKPASHEAQVFHAMTGSVWIDKKQYRVEEISGRLTQEVKFGGGLLGHLDPGGNFDVKQAEVTPGFWELTVLDVHMKGKALLFKTIGVQQDYSRSEFKRMPEDLTAAKAAEILNKETTDHKQAAMQH